ncbi:HTH-type transcriptional repressor NicR [Starkeya nomas]|uniref:HTH-type transcriptional repressor NicR n=2 Tax=Xanthobacteraceae TaxID=335928 RepID=A0A5S9N8Z5_9HYPH|nr:MULTISPECIES: MarR family transcriptional regulator [Xanthobacteraceae]TSJ60897.1 MarR family transcriptional regulator [Ancylobacter moscoviensis]CAA0086531.1 HTH-type transcriptional repressor NicR [Starkeya nomas]
MIAGGPDEPADERAVSVDAYRLDEQVGFLMRVASQRHTALFAARMIEGLTPPQFATLAKLREAGPCSQNRLGRLVYLDAATIKGVVDRLRARGFVLTADDPLDRRRRAVGLSDRGREVADAAVVIAREITEATLEPLNAEEREQIVKLLRKLG